MKIESKTAAPKAKWDAPKIEALDMNASNIKGGLSTGTDSGFTSVNASES